MPQILFVCTANICRSPVAAALLREKLDAHGRNDWLVRSAGTWATAVRGPSRVSMQLMAEKGIDISTHQAQMIDGNLIAQSALVLCMEMGHVEALKIEFPDYQDRIFALSEMVGKPYSIPDPYGGSVDGYRRMIADVERLISEGFSRIVALAERNAAK